jgi:metal-responsive CopG/Arc/MetJ family transcriptional regulator
MKVKTSITLSEDLLKAIDQRTGLKNRSEFIELALRAFIAQIIRGEQNAKDIQIINKRAAYLNREAADVLDYQVKL